MRFIFLIALFLIHIQFNNAKELIAVISKPAYAFLKNASNETKREFIELEENREISRIQLEHLKDELIKKQSSEVQKLYEEKKRFEKFREQQIHEGLLHLLTQDFDSPVLQNFMVKAQEVYHDATLSHDQMCSKLLLLSFKDKLDGALLGPYGCQLY